MIFRFAALNKEVKISISEVVISPAAFAVPNPNGPSNILFNLRVPVLVWVALELFPPSKRVFTFDPSLVTVNMFTVVAVVMSPLLVPAK